MDLYCKIYYTYTLLFNSADVYILFLQFVVTGAGASKKKKKKTWCKQQNKTIWLPLVMCESCSCSFV